MSKAATSESFNEIATVRVELRGTDPLIWREVEVPTSISLEDLHEIIQAVMRWQGYHLWEFTVGKRRYGPPSDEDEERWDPPVDAAEVQLRDVLKPRRTTLDYLYDFGDGWQHRLTVNRVRQGEPRIAYPRYVGGERNAPPEDCGGIHGFYAKLEVLGDPQHPKHADIVQWMGAYDSEAIDEAAVKAALRRIANYLRAAARRGKKKSALSG